MQAEVTGVHRAMSGISPKPSTTQAAMSTHAILSSSSRCLTTTAMSKSLVQAPKPELGGSLWSTPKLNMDNTLTSVSSQPEAKKNQPHDDTGGRSLSPSSRDDGEDPVRSGGEQDVMSKSQGVVYAKLSPFPYGAWSRMESSARQPPRTVADSKTPSSTVLLPGGVHSSVAETRRASHEPISPHESETFLESLYAPAPPPLHVALQVPAATAYDTSPLQSQAAAAAARSSQIKPTNITIRDSFDSQFKSWDVDHGQHSHLSFGVTAPTASVAKHKADVAELVPRDDPAHGVVPVVTTDITLDTSASSAKHGSSKHSSNRQDAIALTSKHSGRQDSDILTRTNTSTRKHSTHKVVSDTPTPTTTPAVLTTTSAKSIADTESDSVSAASTDVDITADSTLRNNTHGSTGDHSNVFNVARLFESLQQLNRTQGQLQATADKLRSLPPASADALSFQASTPPAYNTSGHGGVVVKDSSISQEVSIQQQPWFTDGKPVDLSLSCLSSLPEDVNLPVSQVDVSAEQGAVGKGPGQRHISFSGEEVASAVKIEKVGRAHNRQGASESSPTIIKRKVAFEKSPVYMDADDSGLVGVTPPGASFKAFDMLMEKKAHIKGKPGGKEETATWFALSSHLA